MQHYTSQFQLGGGKLVLDAMEKSHPACYRRLVNNYPLPERYLVARDGTLQDNGASKATATEAFVCALAVSDLVRSVKAEAMGLPAGAAQNALVLLFKQQLGEQSKVVWENGRTFEDISQSIRRLQTTVHCYL